MGLWSAVPGGTSLFAATVGFVAAAVWGGRRTWLLGLGSIVVLGGILTGFAAHRQVGQITGRWEGYWAEREGRVEERLATSLDDRLLAAETAADELAQLLGRSVPAGEGALPELRERHGVSALALYGPAGELLVWDGVHRGKVPEGVQRGLRRYAYGDLPLFGYLYVTAPAGEVGTAVAAILLRSDLPDPLASDADDFASRFGQEVGEEIRIVQPGAADLEGGWDFQLGTRALFTVVLDPPSPESRVNDILGSWRVMVGAVMLLAWLLLALGGPPRLAAGAVAAFTLLFLAAVLPFQELRGLGPLFDRLRFQVVGIPLSLGRFAALSLAGVTVISVAPRPRFRLSGWGAGIAAAVTFPLILLWLGTGPGREILAEGQAPWVTYQGTVAILLTLVVGSILALVHHSEGGRVFGLGGVIMAAFLGAGSAAWIWTTSTLPPWWAALWGVPVAMAAYSMGGWTGWQRAPAAWVLAGLLAGTAAVPAAWAHRVDARMREGETTIRRMAAPEDPDLERALLRLGRGARALARSGEAGVDLLYGAWRASGLDDLGAPAWLTIWSPAGIPEEELRVGMSERPSVAAAVQQDSASGPPVRIVRFERDDARYVLRATLPGGEILTLAGGTAEAARPLTLIPAESGSTAHSEELDWVRTEQGWQIERPLTFPNGAFYHAHYDVLLPGALLALARATLLVILNVALFLAFWVVGRGLLRDVGLALFGFFVLANAIFGTVAYRTIAGTSRRAAQVLAERVADDASGWYLEVGGQMQALARRVGVELLEYRAGELREGSVEELVELGLYEGWVSMDVFRILEGREGIREFTETALGRWEYVTAYRRLPDGDVLAAQVPLQAGASAIRSADVAQLLAFAVVVGAALSLGLALLVGRALTRPIHTLQVASERVGAGNLRLRLPAERADEFGSVFRAFNRMVARLRRARRQLIRTTRRTQAIMEEAAVGMVALDPSGRVTMVNPRAVGLLETELQVGDPVPSSGPVGTQLAEWLELFLAREAEEADLELQPGDRRVRVRARRLGSPGARGGAVVALEDVTDELRTERVLAWGEMARQVAHEVKNPLTPIKLSVQHIRRAWDDRNPEFDSILERNADAMLVEIERLATIAKSFSRFGAPSGPEVAPLTAVDVGAVVKDMLTLYEASEGPVVFDSRVADGLPLARARVSELKEVLVNLLENARNATREGGGVVVHALSAEEGGVLIRVVDDGAGIPEELMPKVFEPHFSSRTTGTGLGLAIVRRLVESWGGAVSLGSSPEEGTVVSLELLPWD
jgi:signal transduction histidine kinase